MILEFGFGVSYWSPESNLSGTASATTPTKPRPTTAPVERASNGRLSDLVEAWRVVDVVKQLVSRVALRWYPSSFLPLGVHLPLQAYKQASMTPTTGTVDAPLPEWSLEFSLRASGNKVTIVLFDRRDTTVYCLVSSMKRCVRDSRQAATFTHS